jgi:hypothetical protein
MVDGTWYRSRWTKTVLAARGVGTFLYYGGAVLDQFSHAGQFADVFRNESFFGHAQRRTIDVVANWVRAQADPRVSDARP